MVSPLTLQRIHGGHTPRLRAPLRDLEQACQEMGFETIPNSLRMLVIRITIESKPTHPPLDVFVLVGSLGYYGWL